MKYYMSDDYSRDTSFFDPREVPEIMSFRGLRQKEFAVRKALEAMGY
jgi:hypothetical protein